MCFDIANAVEERAEFSRFTPDVVAVTATILVRFGIESFVELRSTRIDQRSHFLADAKKPYRFKSMKMVRELFATFPPVKKGRNLASMDFNEIQIPHRLKSLHLDCSTISGTLRPVQEMVNAISEEMARGVLIPNLSTPMLFLTTTNTRGYRGQPLILPLTTPGKTNLKDPGKTPYRYKCGYTTTSAL